MSELEWKKIHEDPKTLTAMAEIDEGKLYRTIGKATFVNDEISAIAICFVPKSKEFMTEEEMLKKLNK